MKIDSFVKKVKKSHTALTVGIILFLLSSLITIANGVSIIGNYYNQTFGAKSISLNALDSLSAGVDINYFNKILGSPVFKNNRQENALEYIYVNRYYYVQAVTTLSGTVVFYSVTTRDKYFNPEISFGEWDEVTDKQEKVVLGKTTFDELGDNPGIYANFPGMHNHFYTEGYWTGNPGGYRTYFFSDNDSGYGENEMLKKYIAFDVSSSTKFGKDEKITDIEIMNFRENAVINTYTVTAPMATIDDIGDIEPPDSLLGPNRNQVRILDWH